MSLAWAGKEVVVVGAGRSGRAAAELLLTLGGRVALTDRRSAKDLTAEIDALDDRVDLHLGDHPASLWRTADAVIASPGIPPDAAPLRAAAAAGCPVYSEIELAASAAEAPIVAITGSNGKSTVTAMTAAILAAAGYDAPACGNIGLPFSRVVDEARRGQRRPERYVVEMSSFQTETIQHFRPTWSALLNISADHLDRHHDLDAYANAKLRIATNCTTEDWFVYGADDPWISDHLPKAPRAVPFGSADTGAAPAAWTAGGSLHWRDPEGRVHAIAGLDELPVLGAHNALNAAAATALACLAGASPAAAATALLAFRGLEHRMEFCGAVAGVECVNDSKATNVGATIAALRGLDRPIWLILGGRDKDSNFRELLPHLGERVRGVMLIGEAAPRIADALDGAAELTTCGDLETAVDTALRQARAGDLILLAPACASFDQYTGFEERGRHFRRLIATRAHTD
jgi:UDP-N-acetylmuramoylalanine--D-glutamate ligase